MIEEAKKRDKIHKILTCEEASELSQFLQSKRGNQKEMAEEIGVTEQSVTAWMKEKKFPQYCRPFLKKLKVLREVNKL